MEVVITADAEAAAELVAGVDRRRARHQAGAGARAGDGQLAARRLPAV